MFPLWHPIILGIWCSIRLSYGRIRYPFFHLQQEKLPKTKRKGAAYLPDECVSEDFEKGQKVWSASYHAPAIIKERYTKEYQDKNAGIQYVNYEERYGCGLYSIWVIEGETEWNDRFGQITGGFNAHQLAYDLGSLKHLEEYGVKL